jgi:voltage-gated potassium channel Kch
MNLPVYFGDAGSQAVLRAVGAERAACAVITLDTPGANYRAVWTLQKYFSKVRAHRILLSLFGQCVIWASSQGSEMSNHTTADSRLKGLSGDHTRHRSSSP